MFFVAEFLQKITAKGVMYKVYLVDARVTQFGTFLASEADIR